MTTHTPTPWFVAAQPAATVVYYTDADGIEWNIATLEQGRASEQADAQRIVTAVNAHDELLAALRGLTDSYSDAGCDGCGVVDADAYEKALDAIAKVQP